MAEPIQMQVPPRGGGGYRAASAALTRKLIVGALAAARWAGGVTYLNTSLADGKPAAIAIIPDSWFSTGEDGITVLDSANQIPARN
jgi:hypothetical protein